MVVTFASGGRPYYPLPLTTVVMLAGVAAWKAERIRTVAVLAGPEPGHERALALPVLPSSQADVTANVNETIAEQIGWPAMVDQVAAARRCPAPERAGVGGAPDPHLRRGRRPRPLRPRPGASRRRTRATTATPTSAEPSAAQDGATVVAVRYGRGRPAAVVQVVREGGDRRQRRRRRERGAGRPDRRVCRGLRGTWPEVWDEVRFLS